MPRMNAEEKFLPRLLIGLLPATLALALMLVFAALHWPAWTHSFSSDFSPAAWLSGAQLLAATLLAARLGVEGTLRPAFAVALTLGLLALALDEQFMLHEHWKYGCVDWWRACASAAVRELPTLLVGALGSVFLLMLCRQFAGAARWLVVASLGVGLAALAVDLLQPAGLAGLLEEAIEVLAEALFLGALLIARPVSRAQVHSP
ncbi:MAG: hypothetical protein K0R03_2579 [Moraxellaceae bacterium]|jgi:hypothetical protein|nr:hypothetical protein [Moraxellaceae bacterium]